MRPTASAAAVLPLLLILGGCQSPKPILPTWSQEVDQASTQQATRRVAESDLSAFLEGFRHGASMVSSALEELRIPFRLSLDYIPPAPRPKGPLPPGVTLEPEPLQVEVDASTGLPLAPVLGGQGAWARGAEDGFDWALGRQQERMRQAGLIRPLRALGLPEPEQWQPLSGTQALTLRADKVTYRVGQQEGVLLWEAGGRGYAPTRVWRALDGHEIIAVAATDEALWLRLKAGQGAVLDRNTGFVRQVLTPEALTKALEPNADREAKQEAKNLESLRQAAARGEAQAMYLLGARLRGSDPASALDWLQRAADRGSTQAMIALGMACLEGQHGLTVDPVKGRAWLERAAKAGDPEAELGLKLLDAKRDGAAQR